jgi:hypothetical protein
MSDAGKAVFLSYASQDAKAAAPCSVIPGWNALLPSALDWERAKSLRSALGSNALHREDVA